MHFYYKNTNSPVSVPESDMQDSPAPQDGQLVYLPLCGKRPPAGAGIKQSQTYMEVHGQIGEVYIYVVIG